MTISEAGRIRDEIHSQVKAARAVRPAQLTQSRQAAPHAPRPAANALNEQSVIEGEYAVVDAPAAIQQADYLTLPNNDAAYLVDYIDDYYAVKVNKLKTVEAVKRLFDRFISPFLAGKDLNTVTTPMIYNEIERMLIDYAQQEKNAQSEEKILRQEAIEAGKPIPEKPATTRHTNHGEATSKKVLAYYQSLFKWLKNKGIVATNPAIDVDRSGLGFTEADEAARDRHLEAHEVPLLFAALKAAPKMQDRTKYGIELLLLTGVRTNELRIAKWSDVDLDNAIWQIPKENTKTNKALTVYLSTQAVALFEAIKPSTISSGYVMGKLPKSMPDKMMGKALTRLQQKNKSGHCLLQLESKLNCHDLRRSCVTFMAEMGVKFEVREKIVNHSLGALENVYNKSKLPEECRNALQNLADHLYAL
tara:strand:- start:2572 stop:3825 length:1254 start_codon:yes stop_codon:yes gene_type:complete